LPPEDARFDPTPPDATVMELGGAEVYSSDGVFYEQQTGQRGEPVYAFVAPPVGTEVEELPKGSKAVQVNDSTYYEYQGAHFEAIDRDGKTVFRVVENPVMALAVR
jgi:hypothetical protein